LFGKIEGQGSTNIFFRRVELTQTLAIAAPLTVRAFHEGTQGIIEDASAVETIVSC